MAIRDDFFTALTNGAKWDVGVSINRTNPLPLDQYSVFQTEAKLNEYIAGAFSYPGQIIALVDENATTIYYLDQNKEKQPVGIIPEGDEKTIEVSAAGAIALLGAADAENGTLPMIGEDGKLTWKTLEDIGAGDGNDNTTYIFTALTRTIGEGEDAKEETYGFKVETLFNGQPAKDGEGELIPAQEFDFGYTKSEIEGLVNAEKERALGAEKALDDKIGAAATPETSEGAGDGKAATGIYAELEKKVDKTTYATDKKALEDEDAAVRAIAEEAKTLINDFLTGSDTDEVVNKLQEIQAELDKLGDVVDLEAALALKADLQYVNAELAKKQDTIPENTYDAYGSAATAKTEAISAAAADATTKADAAKTAAIADADGKLALKANAADVYAKTETYSQSEIDDLLEGIQAGSSESAASVATKLDNFKKATNLELYGNEEGTGNSRIDALEAVGAQANVIESVVASATAKITATKDGKTVTIDDAALVADIKAAKDAADAADAKAAANATAITGLDTRLQAAETKGNDNAAAIAAHATEFATLKGRVDAHDTTLLDKANKTDVYTKEEVNAITGTPTEGKTLVGMIAEKANASDVYTKNDVYTKTETNAEIKKVTDTIGTVTEGKTLVEMIEEAKNDASYDDTALANRVKANEDAIAIINGDDKTEGSIAKAKADALAATSALEIGAVAANTAAIAKLNGDDKTEGSVDYKVAQEVAKILNDNDDSDIDTLEEIAAWIKNDTAGVADLNRRITANETAISLINDENSGILAQAKADTTAQITALDLANTYETKGAAATALADAKSYTDGAITALGMANYKVKEVVSGHDALTVSTDEAGKVTIGFASEIILNGGSATIA